MEINNLKLLIDKINREIDSLDDVSVDNCDENNILIVETLTYHFDIDDPGRNYDINLIIDINPQDDWEFHISTELETFDSNTPNIIQSTKGSGINGLFTALAVDYLIDNDNEVYGEWKSTRALRRVLLQTM